MHRLQVSLQNLPVKLKHFERNEKYRYTVKPTITMPEKITDPPLFAVSTYEKYW